MKKLCITIALTLFSVICFSQVKKLDEQVKSKIESFSERAGTLIKKEFIEIGKFNSIQIRVLRLTDVTTNVNTAGIRLEKSSSGSDNKDFIVFLDSDEVDGMIKSLTFMIENVVNKPVPDLYIEYNFQSRSGFRIGTFKSDNKWGGFLQLDKYNSDSELFISGDELTQLRDIITQAKAKM